MKHFFLNRGCPGGGRKPRGIEKGGDRETRMEGEKNTEKRGESKEGAGKGIREELVRYFMDKL
jgi:hypothetical protein